MVLLLWPDSAWACAVCKCGDPTLTTMGTEQPFEGRKRVSTDFRYRRDRVGQPGVDQIDLQELKSDFSFSYAPSRDWIFALTLPVVARELTYVNLAKDRSVGLGEAEFRARRVFGAGAASNQRQLFSVSAGLKMPTAPIYRDDEGLPLSVDLQAGTGSWDLIGGLAWARFFHPYTLYGSFTVQIPSKGLEEMKISPLYFGTLAAQYQWGSKVSMRALLDARSGGDTRYGDIIDENTGGWIAYGGGDLLFMAKEDLILRVGASYPLYQALKGYHEEGLMATMGVVYDF